MHAGLLPLQLTLFTSRVQVDEDGYNSVATLRDVPLHQTWVLILCHSQICLLVQSTLSDMHAGFIYSDTHVCKVLIRQARHLVFYTYR